MGQLSATYAPLVCHMWATCEPDYGHMWATRGPALQNMCGPHVCLKWELFQLPHVGLVWPTCGMFAGKGSGELLCSVFCPKQLHTIIPSKYCRMHLFKQLKLNQGVDKLSTTRIVWLEHIRRVHVHAVECLVPRPDSKLSCPRSRHA